MKHKTFIIAEAGVNHNGNLDTAFRLVDVARDAEADAVKFQTFWGFPKYKHLELSKDDFVQLKKYCDNVGIEFMSTPDTIEAVDFLAELGMKRWKIGSRNATNAIFLKYIAKLPGEIYLSTGMCDGLEIIEAYNILSGGSPVWRSRVVLMQCISMYPTPFEHVNLRAMVDYGSNNYRLYRRFGLSDHTLGIHIPIAAVAMGASVIEKHFTLDKTQEGADHHMSLEPYELSQMVRCIRDVEAAMGDGVKRPTEYELKVRDAMRNYEDCK